MTVLLVRRQFVAWSERQLPEPHAHKEHTARHSSRSAHLSGLSAACNARKLQLSPLPHHLIVTWSRLHVGERCRDMDKELETAVYPLYKAQ